PTKDDVLRACTQALNGGFIMVTKVNSEKEIEELLDDSGQLKLRVPLNIFIGGQILDRGITIGNLIGFYYGRNPKTFQQDTVLQHSRMFGYRPHGDLAVTRFYTTERIHNMMCTIHEFDSSLRTAIANGDNNGVAFIQRDTKNKIIPCSPNKVLLSDIVMLKPHKRILPVGFQTGYKTYIRKTVEQIDALVDQLVSGRAPVLVDVAQAVQIAEWIKDTYDDEAGIPWRLQDFVASLRYLAANCPERVEAKDKVWLLVRKNRSLSRVRSTGRLEDSPVNASGNDSDLAIARKFAVENPVLILTRQEGLEEQGWRGTPFYWPVLIVPGNAETVVFSGEAKE
ncbi:MAG: Z1 domain-containing protein, partial [Bacilli bacterium]